MSNFHQINPTVYFSGAIVLGGLQVIDGFIGLSGYLNRLNQAFSLLEVCWFVVTLYVFMNFKSRGLSLLLPGLYLGYTLYGLLVGVYLSSNHLAGDVFILPVWYMVSATLFGFMYCAVGVYSYRR